MYLKYFVVVKYDSPINDKSTKVLGERQNKDSEVFNAPT